MIYLLVEIDAFYLHRVTVDYYLLNRGVLKELIYCWPHSLFMRIDATIFEVNMTNGSKYSRMDQVKFVEDSL